jgi:hypothetical protein
MGEFNIQQIYIPVESLGSEYGHGRGRKGRQAGFPDRGDVFNRWRIHPLKTVQILKKRIRIF